MAEYREVMHHFNRMCWKYKPKRCIGCPIPEPGNISHCRVIMHEDANEFERIVMAWAKAHPEPQYPTWIEYFCHLGLCEKEGEGYRICVERFNTPMYPDVARKLGVKPKEG